MQIDWGSAEVDDGRLTVPVTGKASKKWADAVTRVLDRQPDDERSEADEQMTDAFRAFGER